MYRIRLIRSNPLWFTVVVVLVCISSARCWSKTGDTDLAVGVLRNWPPHYAVEADSGSPKGFAVEIFEKIAEKAELSYHYMIFDSWPEIHEAVRENKVDVVPNMGITKERLDIYDFTGPVEAFDIQIFVRETTNDIHGLSDLKQRKTGVVAMNKGAFLMKKQGESILEIYDSLEKAFLSLISGNIDALVYPEPNVRMIAAQAGLERRIKSVGDPLFEVKRGIAVRKGQPELLDRLSKSVANFASSPDYEKIYRKYFKAKESYWNATRILLLMSAVLTGTIGGLLLWRYYSIVKINGQLEKSIALKTEAEQKQQKQQKFLEKAQEIGSIGTWELDLEKNELIWTDENYRIFGIPVGTPLTYETFLDCIHPEDRNYVDGEWKASLTGAPYDIEHRLLVDGKVKWVREKAELEFDDTGRCIRGTGVTQDITYRKLRDEEVRLYEIVVSSASEPMAVIDENYAYQLVNRSYKEFWNLRKNDIIGKHVQDVMGSETFNTSVKPNVDRCLKNGETIKYSTWFDSPLMGRRYMKLNYYPYRDSSGSIIGLINISYDATEEKEILEQLKQLAHDQEAILDNVPAYIYFKDKENNIIKTTERVARVTGIPKSQIEGHHSSKLYPETADRYWEDDLEVIRTGQPKFGIIESLPAKDGETRLIHTDKIPYFGEGGRVDGVIVMGTDITERVDAERQLKASEEKFRSLFEYAADAIYLVSNTGRIIDVNNAAELQTGYTRDQLLAMRVRDLDPRSAEEGDKNVIWEQLRPGETYALKTTHRRRDGSFFPVEINISIIELSNEWALIGFVRDVTEKEKILQDLKESEERLSLAFQGANDGLWDWNLETDEVFYSPRWKSMLGYDNSEIKNHFSEWERLVLPNDREKASAIMRDYLAGNRDTFKCEFRMRHKSGKLVDILSRAFAIRRESDNQPLRVVGTHVDITERREMEKRLQQAQKMESVGNLAGGIAHDFNNILFPIIGMAELLMEDFPSESQEHENAHEIFNAGKRGGDLVKQILAFSRQSEHRLIPVRIQQILKEVLKLSRSTIPAYIEIHQDIQSDCGLVMADPTQIHQVAMNIITNAYHAVEQGGGKISVTLHEVSPSTETLQERSLEAGRYALISIADTGHGIPADLRNKIFEPYFTTKEMGKGTGLGLAVVYGIIKEHGGDISVASELGQGATFDVYLPLMERQVDTEPAGSIDVLPEGAERILLVDDEKPIIKLEKQMLERLGYTVTSCLSSLEALEIFKADPDAYDLVVSDMSMPNMAGDELSKALKKIRPHLPVIICTGFSERINRETAMDAGINGFVMKPVVRSDLARTVRNVLDEGSV